MWPGYPVLGTTVQLWVDEEVAMLGDLSYTSASFSAMLFLPLRQASCLCWNKQVGRGRSLSSKVLFMCWGKSTSSINHWWRVWSFQNYSLYIDLWWIQHHSNPPFWVSHLCFSSAFGQRRDSFSCWLEEVRSEGERAWVAKSQVARELGRYCRWLM